jgi:hypothetical protein
MINEEGQQWLAEAAYEHFRERVTREQMADMIDMLLSDKESSPLLKKVVLRMAMIFSSKEGHS